MANSNSKVAFTEGAGTNIATHAITEGGETRHVERFAPGSGCVDMPTTEDISAVSVVGFYPTTAYLDCVGKARIILNPVLSVLDETAGIRIAFYDGDSNLIGFTEEVSTVATDMVNASSAYYGEVIIIANEVGASSYKVRIVTAPATGTVSFMCGAL